MLLAERIQPYQRRVRQFAPELYHDVLGINVEVDFAPVDARDEEKIANVSKPLVETGIKEPEGVEEQYWRWDAQKDVHGAIESKVLARAPKGREVRPTRPPQRFRPRPARLRERSPSRGRPNVFARDDVCLSEICPGVTPRSWTDLRGIISVPQHPYLTCPGTG